MKRPLLFLATPVLALALVCSAGCGSGQKEELQGRPLVLQLGMKITTASTPQELDAVAAKLPEAKLGAGSREHLTKAVEVQRKLLETAAEMDMNQRMDAVKKVMTEVEAASAAVE